ELSRKGVLLTTCNCDRRRCIYSHTPSAKRDRILEHAPHLLSPDYKTRQLNVRKDWRLEEAPHPCRQRQEGLHVANIHKTPPGQADTLLRTHSTKRKRILRKGELQGPIRVDRTRTS